MYLDAAGLQRCLYVLTTNRTAVFLMPLLSSCYKCATAWMLYDKDDVQDKIVFVKHSSEHRVFSFLILPHSPYLAFHKSLIIVLLSVTKCDTVCCVELAMCNQLQFFLEENIYYPLLFGFPFLFYSRINI